MSEGAWIAKARALAGFEGRIRLGIVDWDSPTKKVHYFTKDEGVIWYCLMAAVCGEES